MADERSPQLEDGYVRIANELLEALVGASANLTKRETFAFLAILRETYGWQRKEAPMTAAGIAEMTGFDPRNCRKALASLEEKGLIRRRNAGLKNQVVAVNKHHGEWFSGSKRPANGGSKRPAKSSVEGQNDPPLEGQNDPLNGTPSEFGGSNRPALAGQNDPARRVKLTRETPLQPTHAAASSVPKDSKDRKDIEPLPRAEEGSKNPPRACARESTTATAATATSTTAMTELPDYDGYEPGPSARDAIRMARGTHITDADIDRWLPGFKTYARARQLRAHQLDNSFRRYAVAEAEEERERIAKGERHAGNGRTRGEQQQSERLRRIHKRALPEDYGHGH